jgi:hypothetical protein
LIENQDITENGAASRPPAAGDFDQQSINQQSAILEVNNQQLPLSLPNLTIAPHPTSPCPSGRAEGTSRGRVFSHPGKSSG